MMNCLCKCIGSSCAAPISSNACAVCQVIRSPSQRTSFLHTAPLLFRSREVLSSPKLAHQKRGFGLLSFFNSKLFASAQHTFIPARSLSSDVKRAGPESGKLNSAKPKKAKVNAMKDSRAAGKSSEQAETKKSHRKVQAKSKSLAKQMQTRSLKQAHILETDSKEDLHDDQGVYAEDFEDDDDEQLESDCLGAGEEETIDDEDAFIDDMLAEEGEGIEDIVLGDGGDGGGMNIRQTQWGEQALSIAKSVLEEFGSNFSLYAFKTSFENRIYVRLDKLSDKYGSPSMVEIESFSSIYGKRLEEAGQSGILPDNVALEVSSPGAERVVQVPDQLERFKGLPMLVRYEAQPTDESKSRSSPVVKDGIWEITSLDRVSGNSVWKLANVRANREQAGKGRGLTKKQKEWRTELPFSSLCLVRLYMDI